jgi:hypothetical protein
MSVGDEVIFLCARSRRARHNQGQSENARQKCPPTINHFELSGTAKLKMKLKFNFI